MKKTATAATLNSFTVCGERKAFTGKQLSEMAEQIPGRPVLESFDPGKIVGKAISGKIKNGNLLVTIELNDDFIDEAKKMFLVPGFTEASDGGISGVILAVTKNPCDKTLPPI